MTKLPDHLIDFYVKPKGTHPTKLAFLIALTLGVVGLALLVSGLKTGAVEFTVLGLLGIVASLFHLWVLRVASKRFAARSVESSQS